MNAILEAQPSFEKVGIFTSPSTVESKGQLLKDLRAKGVEVHTGDFKSVDDVKEAYAAGYDTVVSAVGRPVIEAQIQLLEIAENTPSIKKFFPSEYGTDIEYGPQSKDEAPHQLKLKVRKYIRESIKQLEYTYVVTGPFAEGYIGKSGGADDRIGSIDVKAKKATLLGTGKDKISLTTNPE